MKVNLISKYSKDTGKINMEKDEAMLNLAIENGADELYLRFYGWKPRCISFGRNQKDFIPPFKIDTVRRITGGRALLHDDEITYAIAGKIKENESVIDTYKRISGCIIKGFETLGINLEFAGDRGGSNKYCMNISSGADICYSGKKFIGSAQFRSKGYFLQHGSILKSFDKAFLEKIFSEPVLADKIITLKEINPDISDIMIINALTAAFKGN